MVPLDSLTAVAEWVRAILLELVTGIKNTWNYWYDRKDRLEEVFGSEE